MKSKPIIMIAFLMAILPVMSYGQWSTEFVDTTGKVGNLNSIAVDADGYSHISYFDRTNWDLKYAHWDGSAWQVEVADSTGYYGATSIVLDTLGNPHISCKLEFPEYYHCIAHIWWDGTDWQRDVIETGTEMFQDIGDYTAIALDASDYPHVAYTHYPSSDFGYLKYGYKDASGWHTVMIDSIGCVDGVKYCDIALDNQNYPHISYYDYDVYDLKYAYWDGATWHIESVDTAGHVGKSSSIALDSLGYPHIAYTDGTNYGVKYARWDGSAWQIETVESDIGYGFYTSLALDANDHPHISSAEYASDLRFAYWDGSVWQIEVVDDAVGCGWTSLAIDGDGYSHIAYYDDVYEVYDLRYARRAPTGVEETRPIPAALHLAQNYPNPFNSVTSIQYTLPRDSFVRLSIYNISGQLVRTLVNRPQKPGNYTVSWDGRNNNGEELSSGIYLYRLDMGEFKDTKKMILL